MERDDVIEYSLDTHHSEEEGKILRKKIWKVTAILTTVTFVEVLLGANIGQDNSMWPFVKWTFIILTLLKAGYIVLSFMHLGDERKVLKYVILAPYIVFMIYLIFILISEGSAVGGTLQSYGV
jgi:cytochrome c oxidase subunit 4